MRLPPATAAFFESALLLIKLHTLATRDLDESPEADAVRDAMDGPWDDMTDEEQARVRQLSADLYTIGDRSIVAGPDNDLRLAFGRARAAEDWRTVLMLLQQHPGLCVPAERACLRGAAWSALGVPAAAILFVEDALRAATLLVPSPERADPARSAARPQFPHLRICAEAA